MTETHDHQQDHRQQIHQDHLHADAHSHHPDEHIHGIEHKHLRVWTKLQHILLPHTHGYQDAALDAALATDRGLWAVKVSLVALLATAVFQVVIVAISGSVALLADTIHNFSDALTAVPLGLAFTLAKRSRDHRYTYGYGRAEDIAGVIIVIMIFLTALEAIRQSLLKLFDPQPITNLGWVAAAAIIGFLGNELVALFRIRVGKQIGSAALVADGYHARTDGFTSLAVLAGALGVWLGFPLLDPIVGLLIGGAILLIVWNSAREMYFRIMDAVDPEVTHSVEAATENVAGVMSVHDIAIRWVGHRLRTELHITVDCELPTHESHHIAEEVRHTLFHVLPALVEITVHVDPCECDRNNHHHHHTQHHLPNQNLVTNH